MTEYSNDNIILIRKRNGKFVYSVISHGLSEDLGLKPKELEKELNEGTFFKRIINRAELTELELNYDKFKEDGKDVEHIFYIKDVHNKPKKLLLTFTFLSGRYNNVEYLLRSKVIE